MLGEALKRAGLATDDDLERVAKEKRKDDAQKRRVQVVATWLARRTAKEIRLVARGDFDELGNSTLYQLYRSDRKLAYDMAGKMVTRLDQPRTEQSNRAILERKRFGAV